MHRVGERERETVLRRTQRTHLSSLSLHCSFFFFLSFVFTAQNRNCCPFFLCISSSFLPHIFSPFVCLLLDNSTPSSAATTTTTTGTDSWQRGPAGFLGGGFARRGFNESEASSVSRREMYANDMHTPKGPWVGEASAGRAPAEC